MGNAQYQYTLQGDDINELNDWAPRCSRELRKMRGVADVNTDQQNRGLQASVVIDRDTASRLGITAERDRRQRSTTRSASGRSRRCTRG